MPAVLSTLNRKKQKLTLRLLDCSAEILNNPKVAALIQEADLIETVNTKQEWLIEKAWRVGLAKHPNREFVEQILKWNRDGYPVTLNEIDCTSVIADYHVTAEEAAAGLKKLLKLVKKKRIFGPFHSRQEAIDFIGHDHFRIWPVFYKREPNKYRLLVNLSFDEGGPSFNDNISDSEKRVRYVRIIEIIKRFTDAGVNYIWTMDAHMAYYSVPIPRSITPYVGIKVCGKYFFYATLTMGMASSCQLYTTFAETMVWIITNWYPLLFYTRLSNDELLCLLMSYIDDFFGGAAYEEEAKMQMWYTRYWWDILGVPTNDDKCHGPHTALTLLGYIFDMLRARLRMSEKRWNKYAAAFVTFHGLIQSGTRPNIHFAIRVRGYLRSMQLVLPYTIPYLRALEHVTNIPGEKVEGRWVYESQQILEWEDTCLEADLDYLSPIYSDWERNQISFRNLLTTRHNCDWTMWTDASTSVGVGGYVHRPNGTHFAAFWEDFHMIHDWQYKPDILFLELMGVVLALNIYTDDTTRGQRVLVMCDNKPAVKICIRKCACLKRPDLTALMQVYCANADRKGFRPYIDHIAGVDNPVADALSRKDSIDALLPFPLNSLSTDVTKPIHDLLTLWELNRNKVQDSANLACDCDDNWLCTAQRYENKPW